MRFVPLGKEEEKPALRFVPLEQPTEEAPLVSPEEMLTAPPSDLSGVPVVQPGGFQPGLMPEQFKAGVSGLQEGYYANMAKNNAQLLNVIDRIDRGEKIRPIDDVLGYADMDSETRRQTRDALQSAMTTGVAKTVSYGAERQGFKRNENADLMVTLADKGDLKKAWQVFSQDPVGIIQQLSVESAPNALPSLIAGGTGLLLKGGVGGLMAGLATGSFPVEYMASITDSLRDSGVDLKDVKAVEAKLRDPDFLEQAGKRAMTRGTVIAAADAASGKLLMPFKAGQLGKNAARGAANIVTETGLEMAGEASAQVASGEEIKLGQVIAEGLGAGPQAAVGTVMRTISEGAKPPEKAPERREPVFVPLETVPPEVSPEAVAPAQPATVAPETTVTPVTPQAPVTPATPEIEPSAITGLTPSSFAEEPGVTPVTPPAAVTPVTPPAEVTPVTPEEKLPSEGLRTMVQREQAAGDKFIAAVGEQFGLTPEQGILALRRLVKDRVVEIDPVAGDFKLKDGRFWNQDVMLKAAGVTPVTQPSAEPGLPITQEEEQLIVQRDREIKNLMGRAQELQKPRADTSLFVQLRGKLDPKEVLDISPDKTFNLLRKKGGIFLDELVSGGSLNPWLPPQLQMYGNEDAELATEKEQEAVEFIKEKLRNRDYLTEDAVLELKQLNYSLESLENEISREAELDELRDVLKDIAETEGVADIESILASYQEAGVGEPAPAAAFELAQETREETLARQAQEEATREAAEAKAIADREREVFQLQPQVVERAAAPSGDLFGARGLAEQPAKKAPEAPPVETGLFAAPEEEAKGITEAEFDALASRGFDDLTIDERTKLFAYDNEFGKSNVEEIKQPDSMNEIDLKPYKGGYVSSLTYIGRLEGKAIPISAFISDKNPVHPDRKSAIKAVAEQFRDLAAKSKDRKALLWLGEVIKKEGISLDKMPKAKPAKEEQAAINRERQAAKREAAKPNAEPDQARKEARVLEMAERLLTKPGNKVTNQEIEFQGDMYDSQTTVYEGRLFKSELDEIRSAFGNAKDITLINEDFRVLTVRLTGKYASDSNAVRIIETVYTPIEGEPTIPLANIPEPGIDQPKVKKLPKGRSPELAALAQQLADGTISKEEYEQAVKKFKPIYPYEQPPKPATYDQAYDALDTGKRDKINPQIPAGTPVGLRLDIPAFNRKGVFVVSIHSKRTPSAAGKAIGYGSVGRIKDVTFGLGKETKALEIAAGEAKDVLQTMEGKWVPSTDAEVIAEVAKNFNNPQWTQVGINPERHSYFWDRFTTMPVISADEVLQIGNFILAKNPVYGNKEDFLYNINSQKIVSPEERIQNRKTFRQETIDELRAVSRRKTTLVEKIKNFGSDLATQKLLNELEEEAKLLRAGISYKPNVTAEAFLKHARDAVEGSAPFREPVLDADVFAVIQQMYQKAPWALEGLRLSIKRRPENKRQATGEFVPLQRIVRLWGGTEGVTNPQTVRHEVMHSLEQMMTAPQRQAIIDSYLKAVNKAIKSNTDKRSQEYFEGVLQFLADPSPDKMQKALEKLPSYEFYQYINPSEYWAVNAEKLMKAKLGTPWEKFKKAVRKLYEALKNVLGFDNRYAVHKLFDSIMGDQPQRITRQTIADYMMPGEYQTTFLANVQKVDDLLAKQNVPDTPMLATSVVKTKIINAARDMKDLFKDMIQNPREIPMMAFNGIDYGITYLRNKNIWFGSGLNAADFARYNGELKTGENLATASLALDNAIRGGNIGIQVIMQGGIKFDDKAKMFVATQTDKGMRQVYEAEARLRDELGAQRATNLIQRYLEAKRSRSIQNEYYDRQAFLEGNKEMLADMKSDPSADPKDVKEMERAVKEAEDDVKSIELVLNKVRLTDEEIDEVIAMEEDYPDLKEIIDNFQAVNKNLLKFWRQVGMLSENRYNVLSRIKDYVPWYRIMDDAEDVHSPLQSTTRTFTNIGKEKIFKAGKPSVVTDFIAEQDQQVYEIQPAHINRVTINGKKVKPTEMGVTSDGHVEIKKQINAGDVVVFYTDREIENIIDNMTRNVMRMTMNGLRQYAATRIVQEYATRNEKDKIMTFPKAEPDKGRFNFIVDGKRVVVEIKDPLVAEAISGMETLGLTMWKPLAAAANLTRRAITLSGTFQLKQVFKDAPTAALVTGVKRPDLLVGGVFKGFVTSLTNSDPAVQILRAAGIGGFHSPARTPEAEVKRQIGVINKNSYDYVIGALDHFGDSSDMAQRVATYKRVMAETGDEAQALYQAANVINFMRHGSGQVAQIVTKTVPFMNAYAQSIDVLFQSLAGGGLKGVSRKRALARIGVTGSLLVGMTLLYCMAVGDDEEYQLLDDQSKLRNYVIPGTKIILPMNTSAAYFFKAIPEMIYNYVMKHGTEKPMDEKRLRTGLKEAAVDMLLGPNPVPSAVKPFVEIALNKNFFTGETVIPRGMEKLETAEQYSASTSEAGKLLSSMTGGKEKRLLSPVEADHLIRSLFGTAGSMAQWASNVIGEAADARPAVVAKDYPFIGPFLRPEVPRGPEDLFYDFKEYTDKKMQTYNRLLERDRLDEAEQYLKQNEGLIAFSEYANETESSLKEINALIRMYGETTDKTISPKEKRSEIENLQRVKNEILSNIEFIRKEAGL